VCNKGVLILIIIFTLNEAYGQRAFLGEQSVTIAPRQIQTEQESIFSGSIIEILNQSFDSITSLSTEVKGFTASMLLPDNTLWKRTWGVAKELPVPYSLTTDHLMGMGSITKTFVSTTLLLMMEDGLLNLQDSIGMYLDDYPNIPGDATIHQLLSHRTGIMDYMNEDTIIFYDWWANPDSIWVVDTILSNYIREQNFQAGTDWSYSNTNYLLAGRIIEKITNQPWYQVVRQRIIDPLGLTHTFALPYESPGNQEISHGWGYYQNFDHYGPLQESGIPIEGLFSIAGSAGCLLTTTEDLVRFNQQLFGGHLLLPSTLAEMRNVYLTPHSYKYGLGAMTFLPDFLGVNVENWGHGGNYVYSSLALYFPEDSISLAVQQNVELFADYIDLNDVFRVLLNEYLNHKSTQPPLASEDIKEQNAYRIFPNPTNGQFTIEILEGGAFNYPLRCVLVDLSGQIIQSFDLTNRKTEIRLDHLPEGMYFLRIANSTTKILLDN